MSLWLQLRLLGFVARKPISHITGSMKYFYGSIQYRRIIARIKLSVLPHNLVVNLAPQVSHGTNMLNIARFNPWAPPTPDITTRERLILPITKLNRSQAAVTYD